MKKFLFIFAFFFFAFFNFSVQNAFATSEGKIGFYLLEGVSNAPTTTSSYNLINPDGSGFTTIKSPAERSEAEISPDGNKIAFSERTGQCNPDLTRADVFIMNIDGTNITNLTANLPCAQWTFPSWFPDGTKIIFEAALSGSDGNGEIYMMDLASSNVQEIIANGQYGNISPDGNKLTYSALNSSFISHVFVANLDGSQLKDLTPEASYASYYFYPRWSPDGQKIAFIDGNGNLYTINSDGTNKNLIPSSEGGSITTQSDYSWSLDSADILFTRAFNGGSGGMANQIVSIPFNGGTPTALYQAPSNAGVFYPWWGRPAGSDLHPLIRSLDAVINEGDTYSFAGSFTDIDSTSWTATVDYGDGSGVQPLTLNSNKTFSLSHVYKDNGNYHLTVAVTDNQGVTGKTTPLITVNNVSPTVGSITAPSAPTQINTAINASANFIDPGILDTHIASWNWGDGNTTTGTVTETNGSGSVANNHTYTTPGVYVLTLTVTDKDGGQATATYQYITIYNTSTKSVSGSKEFISPPGAVAQDSTATGKANFGFTAQYDASGNVIPTGNKWASFTFINGNTNLNFNATAYQWLVVTGTKAVLKGTGTLNNVTGFSVLISAIDGSQTGGVNLIRYQIKDSSGTVVYDTQPGAGDTDDPTTNVSKGKVTIK